ncbi:MAG: T9SS type A sorting domain-containing protein [Bacteroidales bacterium]|nr:T9SS type A sorting domain-containing protein [Bacteroidales bacterium]
MKVKDDYITVVDESNVSELSANEVAIYPNPATSVMNVRADGMQRISIFDITGRLVLDKDCNSDTETIDISKFLRSTYAIRITTDFGTFVRTLVVE